MKMTLLHFPITKTKQNNKKVGKKIKRTHKRKFKVLLAFSAFLWDISFPSQLGVGSILREGRLFGVSREHCF